MDMMTTRNDLVGVVRDLERAANRHAVDEVLGMLADDVEFELEGLGSLVGKEEMRRVFEYDAGVHGELHLVNCTARGQVVECRLVERNDRLREAGLDEMHYPSCVFAFTTAESTTARIRSWRAVPDPDEMRSFERFWGRVRRWIAENHPADSARIFTSDGRFIRTRSNGERAVQLAREYRSTREDQPGS